VRIAAITLVCAALAATSATQAATRARDLGVPFDGTPGKLDAITDVPGVEVGQTTVIRGNGPLVRGRGPVRTGVTIIFPTGKTGRNAVAAGRTVINGTGEFTGMALVDEVGQLFGPIGLTGTGNISIVRDAMIDWAGRPGYLPDDEFIIHTLPAVGETLDIPLNDAFGHPLSREDVFAALDGAKPGPVAEGNVGGGTGMIAYGFKGGIGTASRVVADGDRSYIVGVLLQANHGARRDLRIAGVPVGEEISDLKPEMRDRERPSPKNSLLVIIATDVPLQAHQLQRVARRAALGVGRTGSTAGNYSGEFALAFSTTNTSSWSGAPEKKLVVNDNDQGLMDALFRATVEAVEEALVNQLVASETMVGADDARVYGLPHDRLVSLLKKYNRYRGGPEQRQGE
jgi:L-aminopeptidase/D-esterase-like protein